MKTRHFLSVLGLMVLIAFLITWQGIIRAPQEQPAGGMQVTITNRSPAYLPDMVKLS